MELSLVIILVACLGLVIGAAVGGVMTNSNNARVVRGDLTGGNVVGRNQMGTTTINGRTYTGNNLHFVNNRIIIDGVDVTDDTGVDMKSILEVKVTGDVGNVQCERGLAIVGNVTGNVDARGAVSCDSVGGDVQAGGAVSCDDVRGSVSAGGSVSCDDIGGSVTAGGRVSHG